MDVRRAFILSSYALVLTGILSLALAEGTPLMVAVAGLLTLGAYYQAEARGRPLGRLATNLLIVGALAAAPLDHLAFTGDPVLALAHFLIAVQVVKLFGVKAARDYVQLYLISLMHLGVAAILTIDLVFSVAFFVYMMIATWTLILFTLVRELDARGEPATGSAVPRPEARIGRGLLVGGALVSVAMLASTAFFFVAFPRFSAILFQINRRSLAPRVSGFSDEIGLNDLSRIQENEEQVMSVTLERTGDGFPDPPKWRGTAFDRYENGRWKRSWEARGTPPIQRRGMTIVQTEPVDRADQRYRFTRPQLSRRVPAPRPSDLTTYQILLSPTGTDVLFAVPRVQTIQFLSTTRPSTVGSDPGDAAIGAGLPQTEVLYRVESAPVSRHAAKNARAPADGVVERVDYLVPPVGIADPERIAALATQAVAAAGAETPLERAQALEDFLQREFAYTLDLTPAPVGVDPVEDFLFAKRAGHCELFASAFVMMARAEGLPARLVNGFQSGEWNDFGSFYLVRQSDAHAWAEVHFEGLGWVDFDPTPGGGTTRPSGVLASWRRFQDYVKLRWMNYVISYTLSDQLSLADRARQRLNAFKREALAVIGRIKAWLPTGDPETIARTYAAFSGGIAMLLVGVVVVQRRRARKRKRPAVPRKVVRVSFYEELVRALDARGWRRVPTETPREFAARVAREGGERFRPVARVIEAFYAVRFGGRPLDPSGEAEVRAALTALVEPAGAA